jgi:hypothetical protein
MNVTGPIIFHVIVVPRRALQDTLIIIHIKIYSSKFYSWYNAAPQWFEDGQL